MTGSGAILLAFGYAWSLEKNNQQQPNSWKRSSLKVVSSRSVWNLGWAEEEALRGGEGTSVSSSWGLREAGHTEKPGKIMQDRGWRGVVELESISKMGASFSAERPEPTHRLRLQQVTPRYWTYWRTTKPDPLCYDFLLNIPTGGGGQWDVSWTRSLSQLSQSWVGRDSLLHRQDHLFWFFPPTFRKILKGQLNQTKIIAHSTTRIWLNFNPQLFWRMEVDGVSSYGDKPFLARIVMNLKKAIVWKVSIVDPTPLQ